MSDDLKVFHQLRGSAPLIGAILLIGLGGLFAAIDAAISTVSMARVHELVRDQRPGAVRLAKMLGPGHTIVTILADYGTRYQSKLFNPQFLREKNLPVPGWLERHSDISVPYE